MVDTGKASVCSSRGFVCLELLSEGCSSWGYLVTQALMGLCREQGAHYIQAALSSIQGSRPARGTS